MNLYVSNLGFNIRDEELKKLFAEFGSVSSAKVITDKFTSQSRGFGFVEMDSDAEAQKAIEGLDGSVADGRALKVSVARPRENR